MQLITLMNIVSGACSKVFKDYRVDCYVLVDHLFNMKYFSC